LKGLAISVVVKEENEEVQENWRWETELLLYWTAHIRGLEMFHYEPLPDYRHCFSHFVITSDQKALYRVIQEELPLLMELISDDILSKKCHINLGSYTQYLQSYAHI
jgi:hypothetical protein